MFSPNVDGCVLVGSLTVVQQQFIINFLPLFAVVVRIVVAIFVGIVFRGGGDGVVAVVDLVGGGNGGSAVVVINVVGGGVAVVVSVRVPEI